ncbi:Protein of unknown function [Pyronema omphalodes CBS 100304]|uniref:Uncharacterized protein n=1 Tax=Pyronema omphalodes (strain CBS 100304) TaxID=1076935 RepID=U4KXQ6_PYROM|nr:Protein of unknown function [Pyronema omphalodes CBS 100304]
MKLGFTGYANPENFALLLNRPLHTSVAPSPSLPLAPLPFLLSSEPPPL